MKLENGASLEKNRSFHLTKGSNAEFLMNLHNISFSGQKGGVSLETSTPDFRSLGVACVLMSSTNNMEGSRAGAAGLKLDINSSAQTPAGAMTRQSQALSSVWIWFFMQLSNRNLQKK